MVKRRGSISTMPRFYLWVVVLSAVLIQRAAPQTPRPMNDPNRRCALERNLDQCEDLTRFMNFDEECQCLNFCDGKFIGCCDFNEGCSAGCNSTTSVEPIIVAGCRIDPSKPFMTPPLVVEPDNSQEEPAQCVLRRNNENCPALVQNQQPIPGCGPNACYNYCNDQFEGCCDIDDAECAMECITLGAGEAVMTAGCFLSDADELPPSPPAPAPTPAPKVCVMQQNTENCPRLVQNQPIVEDCGEDGCYNYCNNVFQGCCPIDAFECSIECNEVQEPSVVLTTGCRLSDADDLPPSPPIPAPTPAPKQCLVLQNVENCPSLIADQAVVPDCGVDGCYNYCNNEFQGCCDINDSDCSIECSISGPGSEPPPLVLTAGCRLNGEVSIAPPTSPPVDDETTPPVDDVTTTTCLGFDQACHGAGECCSGRCRFGKCARKPNLGFRQKPSLNRGRGGAAAAWKESLSRAAANSSGNGGGRNRRLGQLNAASGIRGSIPQDNTEQ